MRSSTALSIQSFIWIGYAVLSSALDWGTEFFLLGMGLFGIFSAASGVVREIEKINVNSKNK